MSLTSIINKARKDWPLAKAIVLTELKDFYNGIKSSGKKLSEMSIPNKAALVFGAAVPIIGMQVNCGSHGDSNNNTYVAPPAQTQPGDYVPTIDFTGIDNYFLVNTNIAGNIEDDLVALGGQSVDDVQTVGISTDELANKYNTNEKGFRDIFRQIYKPLLQQINIQNGNAPLADNPDEDDALDFEVDNFVANLTNGTPAGLDNTNYPDGESTVFFGPNMIAYRMISQPPLNTQFVMITLGGLSTPTGALVDETAMATLYDVVNAGVDGAFDGL